MIYEVDSQKILQTTFMRGEEIECFEPRLSKHAFQRVIETSVLKLLTLNILFLLCKVYTFLVKNYTIGQRFFKTVACQLLHAESSNVLKHSSYRENGNFKNVLTVFLLFLRF